VLPHIFEPFFSTRVPISSGLGLSQVFGTIKQHRGHIDVQTELGRGSTISLYLPAIDPSQLQSALVPSAEQHSGGDLLTMVISGHDMVRQALVAALESLDATPAAATSIEDALQQHTQSSQQVRLILTDVTEAQASGSAFVHQLRSSFPAARLVMIGDQIPSANLRTMIRAGTIRWLDKPVDLARLAGVLADVEFDR
jgi:CheY-like chemotaxis protein